MPVLRFNPLFKKWVLLGEAVPRTLRIEKHHRLDMGTRLSDDFEVVSHPHSPFVIDEPERRTAKGSDALLYHEEAPVGEYEIIRYTGDSGSPHQWKASVWASYISLIASRISAFHRNPHLHHVAIQMQSEAFDTTGRNAERVADVIATKHPMVDEQEMFDMSLMKKLVEKEALFVVSESSSGSWYAPSAPTKRRELWFLQRVPSRHIDVLSAKEINGLSKSLAAVLSAWKGEFPRAQYVLSIHGAMVGASDNASWWIRLYESESFEALKTSALPERFAYVLHHALHASSHD